MNKNVVQSLSVFVLSACFFLSGCDKQSTDDQKSQAEQTTATTQVENIGVQLINDNWQYLEKNIKQVDTALSMQGWQPINLPHTWNATDTVDPEPGYRRNASWYQKKLTVGGGHRYVIYFEGANLETEVYANGQLAGKHVGGYLGFDIEVTQFLKPGADNILMVRVSNQYNPHLIPSQKADFSIQGGLTRDVWLKILPVSYVEHLTINTPQVTREQAQTKAIIALNTNLTGDSEFQLNAQLIAPDQSVVNEKTQTVTLKSGTQTVEIEFDSLTNPLLWSVDAPQLYSVKTELRDRDGKKIHDLSDRFGYRWFEMRPHQGFFVNGERVLIRGTHRHEDYAGVGAAVPNDKHRSDMQLIKDMGANFVRLGHYPQDPEVYRAADELGLILWDELPWCRGGKGGEEWERNTESLWRKQIAQNRNHPSIAFWSVGNEMYWEEDFPGGGSDDVVAAYVKKLHDITKELDPSRMTTLRKFYPGAAIVDAFSPSIWAGWYGGAYGQYQEAIDGAMKQYPAFLHMEYGGDSHVGRHTETPVSEKGLLDAQVSVSEAVNQAAAKNVAKDTDWNESYMIDLFDWHLRVSENTPNFAGNAQWVFKDFPTPLRPENPIPYMNQKGLVERNGNLKTVYYVFKSYWAKKPFCYIVSKSWTHREGPKEGRDVRVYCNTKEAELFLNGESLGKKTKDPKQFPAGGLVWKTPFKKGVNNLSVKGYADGVEVEDSLQVNYFIGHHDVFNKVAMTQKPIENGRVLIEVAVLDKNGNRVLDFSEPAYFYNLGESGRLIQDQGTPRGSAIIEMANGYAAIEFEPGDESSVVEFRTQNIKAAFVEVPAQAK